MGRMVWCDKIRSVIVMRLVSESEVGHSAARVSTCISTYEPIVKHGFLANGTRSSVQLPFYLSALRALFPRVSVPQKGENWHITSGMSDPASSDSGAGSAFSCEFNPGILQGGLHAESTFFSA